MVLLILTISYANSLRIYVAQSREIAATQQEIVERQQRITALQGEVAQWDDPAYVKQRARDRLGWVVPGETGYRVVDKNGKPLGGGSEIGKARMPPSTKPDAWWLRLWGSVEGADQPAPVKPAQPKAEKPITADDKPTKKSR